MGIYDVFVTNGMISQEDADSLHDLRMSGRSDCSTALDNVAREIPDDQNGFAAYASGVFETALKALDASIGFDGAQACLITLYHARASHAETKAEGGIH